MTTLNLCLHEQSICAHDIQQYSGRPYILDSECFRLDVFLITSYSHFLVIRSTHFHQMSREMRQMSRIFFKRWLLFFCVADYFTFLPWNATK